MSDLQSILTRIIVIFFFLLIIGVDIRLFSDIKELRRDIGLLEDRIEDVANQAER
jgi:hypothetical protein